MKHRLTLKCVVCGWKWQKRTPYPLQCPNPDCESRDWDGPETKQRARDARNLKLGGG